MSRQQAVITGLIFLSLFFAGLGGVVAPQDSATPGPAARSSGSPPRSLQVASVAALESLFSRLDYHWPLSPADTVPPILIQRLPADFPAIEDSQRRKALFIRALLPIALAENRRLQEQRALASLLLEQPWDRLDPERRQWLRQTARRYRLALGPQIRPAQGRLLLRRLDALPTSLVVAQAAIESGWGTSRFALQGNSLFGQWTYRQGEGMTPKERPEGASHEVRAFGSLRGSVRAYLRNINTGHAYEALRTLRWRLREAGRPLDAHLLAAGLERYSQRGEAYVAELRRMLRSRSFAPLDGVTLRDVADLSTGG